MIVSDAGPLIVLLKTNKLSILKELFETVNVPIAVYNEITAKEQEKALFLKIEWLKPAKIKKDNDYKLLEQLVDKGEAKAIIQDLTLVTSILLLTVFPFALVRLLRKKVRLLLKVCFK